MRAHGGGASLQLVHTARHGKASANRVLKIGRDTGLHSYRIHLAERRLMTS
jgi:hypothetical protein